MTYWEKWRVEIENIGVEWNGKKTEDINYAASLIAVGKDGTPRLCRGLCDNCADCIFYSTENISCVRKAREWLKSEVEPDKPKHKLIISCPTKGRTEESIKKSFEVLKRTAEAYAGEALEVVNPYEPKTFESDADRIRSMGDSIKLIADANYFITVDRYWEHTECGVEGLIAGEYGMKRMLAMTDFAAPDVLKKSKNLMRNPYYSE